MVDGVVPCDRENGLGESENELGESEKSLRKVRGRTRPWNVHGESEEQRAKRTEGREESRRRAVFDRLHSGGRREGHVELNGLRGSYGEGYSNRVTVL